MKLFYKAIFICLVILALFSFFSHSHAHAQTTPTVDLKGNGSDNPAPVTFGDSLNLTWTSTNVTSCTADWVSWASVPTEETTGDPEVVESPRSFNIVCTGPDGSVGDTINVGVSGSTSYTGWIFSDLNEDGGYNQGANSFEPLYTPVARMELRGPAPSTALNGTPGFAGGKYAYNYVAAGTYTLTYIPPDGYYTNSPDPITDQGGFHNFGVIPCPDGVCPISLTGTCNIGATQITWNWTNPYNPWDYDHYLQVGTSGARNGDGSLVNRSINNGWVGAGLFSKTVSISPDTDYYAVIKGTATVSHLYDTPWNPTPNNSQAVKVTCTNSCTEEASCQGTNQCGGYACNLGACSCGGSTPTPTNAGGATSTPTPSSTPTSTPTPTSAGGATSTPTPTPACINNTVCQGNETCGGDENGACLVGVCVCAESTPTPTGGESACVENTACQGDETCGGPTNGTCTLGACVCNGPAATATPTGTGNLTPTPPNGSPTLYRIRGDIWEDTTDNGFSNDDTLYTNVVFVELRDANTNAFIANNKTSTGHYDFPNIPAGSYKVVILPPNGYRIGSLYTEAQTVTVGQ